MATRRELAFDRRAQELDRLLSAAGYLPSSHGDRLFGLAVRLGQVLQERKILLATVDAKDEILSGLALAAERAAAGEE